MKFLKNTDMANTCVNSYISQCLQWFEENFKSHLNTLLMVAYLLLSNTTDLY